MFCLSPFFKKIWCHAGIIGTIFPFLQSSGNILHFKQFLNILKKGHFQHANTVSHVERKFHCHYAYTLEVTGRAFLTLVLQIKYAIPDNPNNVDLRFSPKKQLPQVERKRIFGISLKTYKTMKFVKKLVL